MKEEDKNNQARNKKDVDYLRKKLGMHPIASSKETCICCNRSFVSWDKKYNRLCGNCSKIKFYAKESEYSV